MPHHVPPHTWTRKFAVAFAGLFHTCRAQKSMQVHCACGLLVLGLAALTRLSPLEWAVLFLTIGLVLAMELINTSLEAVVDLASPEHAELARIAKDVAAAAVLVSAMTAIAVGCGIFLPYWKEWLGF